MPYRKPPMKIARKITLNHDEIVAMIREVLYNRVTSLEVEVPDDATITIHLINDPNGHSALAESIIEWEEEEADLFA